MTDVRDKIWEMRKSYFLSPSRDARKQPKWKDGRTHAEAANVAMEILTLEKYLQSMMQVRGYEKSSSVSQREALTIVEISQSSDIRQGIKRQEKEEW